MSVSLMAATARFATAVRRSCFLWRLAALSIAAMLLPAALAVPRAAAGEPYLEFVHALQRNGYGDLAVGYVESWKTRPNVPPAVLEVYDLELSNSLRISAKEAATSDVAAERTDQADKLMEKFAKEHPDHPGVAAATANWAEQAFDRGSTALAVAKIATDEAAKTKALADARAAFIEAHEKFVDARTKLDKAISALKGDDAKTKDARIDIEIAWIQTVFKLAGCDYSLSQTYPGKRDSNKLRALKAASDEFDAIYQRYPNLEPGRRAHMWTGKIQFEMGQKDEALDTLEEVLSGDAEPAKTPLELAPLYIEAQVVQYQIMASADGPSEVLKQFPDWEKDHLAWKKLPEYAQMQLEIAKNQLARADKAGKEEAAKLRAEANKTLTAIANSKGNFQEEAVALLRTAAGGSAGAEATYDELVILADTQIAATHWKEAQALYVKAEQLAEKAKNAAQLTDVKKRIFEAHYREAYALYSEKKWDEAIELAEKLAADAPDSPQAPGVVALALYAAASKYDAAAAADKEQVFNTLKKQAETLIAKWPDRDEANDARSVLARVLIAKGEAPAGIALLEKIPPTSRHYGTATQMVGQIYTKAYFEERKKPEAQRNNEELTKSRTEAIAYLQKSLEAQKKTLPPGAPLTKLMADLQFRLGSLELEAKDPQQALRLLQPLAAEWEKTATESAEMDNATQLMLVNTIRAYAEVGDEANAGRLVGKLIKAGPDTETVNAALVDFAKLIDQERRQADAAVAAASTAEAKLVAKRKQAASTELFRNTLMQLFQRKNHRIASLIYLADAASNAGMTNAAKDAYSRILDKAEKEPAFRKEAETYLTSVEAKLIGMLRNENQFKEAIQRLDLLVKREPNSVGPQLERARTMQAWADQEPKQYPQATAAWATAREMLGRIKPRPPEYYDAVYNTAVCLMAEFKETKDKKKAQQAEQALRSTLVTDPSLSGPEMLEKYQTLLKKVYAAQDKPPPT
ncbi:MAG TPA: tetratricopeptide repeat protein [Pirellulales bacterium]|jgi:hypothetical protein|nr:tetratricopeptide repeat protein [Pirellulales bacterium]